MSDLLIMYHFGENCVRKGVVHNRALNCRGCAAVGLYNKRSLLIYVLLKCHFCQGRGRATF